MSPEKRVYMADWLGGFYAHPEHAQAMASGADLTLNMSNSRMRCDGPAQLDNAPCHPLSREALDDSNAACPIMPALATHWPAII